MFYFAASKRERMISSGERREEKTLACREERRTDVTSSRSGVVCVVVLRYIVSRTYAKCGRSSGSSGIEPPMKQLASRAPDVKQALEKVRFGYVVLLHPKFFEPTTLGRCCSHSAFRYFAV